VRLEGAYLFPGGPLMSVSEYDAGGLLVRQGSIGYGPEGEVLSATGDTETVRFTYDGLYRVKSVKDGKNQTTSYDYDTNGNLTDVYYPGGDHIQYLSYDGAGNPLSVTDANGVTTTFSYGDPGGLLNRIQNATDTIQFSYDSYGRCDHESSGNETINRMFDHLGGVISESTTYAGLVPKTITYAHNPDGSLSTMQTPAGTYSYTYDEIGRITGLTNPLGQSFAWDYLDNNWLNSQTLKNSGGSVIAKTSYLFNPRGMLTGLINESGSGATLSQFTGSPRLAYDAVGNLLSVTAAIPAVPSLGATTTYTYNNKDQLTYEQSTRSGGYASNFAYDSAGNPTTFRGAGRTFNSNNQDTRFTYDLNGNPTGYKSHGLLFDDMDRMKSFDAAFDAAYGTSNLRAFTGPSGSRTYTLFSGGVPVCEMDSSGNVVSTNTFGPTGLLSRRTGATDSFYTFDPQGSVVQTLTGSGTVSATLAYDAYGNPLTGSQGAATPYGYGGQAGYYTDSQTGLILCTNRYYDPVEGRWLTRDPIGYAGGINLYAYCGNNPVNRVDPSGCRSVDDDDWQLVTTTAKYSGGGGLVRAAGVAFTDRYNNEYNADLQTIGLDDYACKNPIGSAALKHGSLTVGRMALDVATLGDTTALVEGGIGLLARPQTVYALFDEAGEVFYIGRSICPKIRELAHRLRFGRTFEMIYQAERLTYNEARGVEQYLIEMHGLEDVGLLRNRINSIREGTPYYNRWRNWGQDYIGLPQ
jgi:RHS repeat-associated protein